MLARANAYVLALSLICSLYPVNCRDLWVYSGDTRAPVTEWVIEAGNYSVVSGADCPQQGSHCWHLNGNATMTRETDTSDWDNLTFTYSMASTDMDGEERCTIDYSVDNGANFNVIQDVAININSGDIVNRTLSGFRDSQLFIIRLHSSGGSCYFEDLRLSGSPASSPSDALVSGNCANFSGDTTSENPLHWHNFTLLARGVVTIDACNSNYDTWLYFRDAATQTDIYDCDDCGPCGLQTLITVSDVDAGEYEIGIGGCCPIAGYEEFTDVGAYNVEVYCAYYTQQPTVSPSQPPTQNPTRVPTLAPSDSTLTPTRSPTDSTQPPTVSPTTFSPTADTANPTVSPTMDTESPTIYPSFSPTLFPSDSPLLPTNVPSFSLQDTASSMTTAAAQDDNGADDSDDDNDLQLEARAQNPINATLRVGIICGGVILCCCFGIGCIACYKYKQITIENDDMATKRVASVSKLSSRRLPLTTDGSDGADKVTIQAPVTPVNVAIAPTTPAPEIGNDVLQIQMAARASEASRSNTSSSDESADDGDEAQNSDVVVIQIAKKKSANVQTKGTEAAGTIRTIASGNRNDQNTDLGEQKPARTESDDVNEESDEEDSEMMYGEGIKIESEAMETKGGGREIEN